jgi:GNAT superfamily N-acetyltransferase
MSCDRIQILPATEADLPAIARLADLIWRAHYPGIITVEQIDYMLERMYGFETLQQEISELGIRFECLLADGQMIGFGAHGPTERLQERKLHKLYLHPQWHGKGLGSRLLQHCEIEARRLNAQRMILTVNKRNTRAIAAYRRNGFTVLEAVVADIGGGFVMDDFLMSKHLMA